jgi:hypothetical protein
MPPQQPDRLLDVFDQFLDFGAHESVVLWPAGFNDCPAPTQPACLASRE